MMRRFSILLFLFCCLSASASSVVIVTFSFTNAAGTTNGMNVTVNSDTRTFTNSVVVPSSQIFTNSTPSGSAQNLWLQLNAFHFSGLSLSSAYPTAGATNVSLSTVLKSDPPTSPSVSMSGNWGTFTISTNPYVDMTAVLIPVSGEPSAAVRTNVVSGLQSALMDSEGTNYGLLKFPLSAVTNAGTAGYSNATAFVIAPTNTPTDAYAIEHTGDQNKWVSAVPQATHATNADNSTTAGSSTNFYGTIFGTNYSFATLNTPTSQGTNWILDFRTATYQKILLTNNLYIQYATNSPGAMSFDFLPNGSDRTLSIPTNWVLLSTNSWSLNTALNPGVWQQVITNATAGAGPRRFWLSLVSDDATGSQTNVVAIGRLSPP